MCLTLGQAIQKYVKSSRSSFMNSELSIGDITAKPGEKKSGRLHIGYLPSSTFSLPLTIINGANDGPIVTITAGQHGTEYVAITAAIEIIRRLEPSELSGAVIAVPVVNTLGLEQRARVEFPVDDCSNGKINLNHIWPGDANGSLAYITIHKLFNSVVKKGQYYIDLHGGDIYEAMTPMVMVTTKTGSETVDKVSRTLAEVFGFDYIVETLAESSRGASKTEASLARIPSILVEVGGSGQLDIQLLNRSVEGILNILKHLNMIKGNVIPRSDCKVIHGFKRIFSKSGGLFLQTVPTGSQVTEGQKIGEVISTDGSSAAVEASATGLLVESFSNPAINTGEVLAEIALLG